ncbi:MAG TPA: ATPase [Rhodospirillaceae bacterium]|nr:ATPase [Rhodospirillaceae bacterium]
MSQPRKAITLIGMSGAGKSYLAAKMARWGWVNYSCDELIGTKYLKGELSGVPADDPMQLLSAFVGKIGNPAKGGLGTEEFRRRQKLYYDAEAEALRDTAEAIKSAHGQGRHFVNDSSGSLCEIEDEKLLAEVGKNTLFVYLKIGQNAHETLLNRAFTNPKPLYFPVPFFKERVQSYMQQFEMNAVEDIDPDEFLRWVFPYLFESRLPKYKALAEKYGVSISVSDIADVESEQDFLNVVAGALGKSL